MKNAVYIVWVTLVMSLFLCVFAVGLYEQKNKEKLSAERSLIAAAKRYIEVNEIKIESSITIPFEDLEKDNYVSEIKIKDKNCKSDVTVEKVFLFFKTYKTNITCE